MATHVMTTNGLARNDGRRSTNLTLLERVEMLGQRLLAAWTWYENYRRTANELNQLSERELDDIGIARRDIPTIAMRSANAAKTVR